MSCKDYILIANALAHAMPETSPVQYKQWENDCRAVANALRMDNGRFDEGRFLTACGIED